MSVARGTLLFAVFIFIGYQAGFIVAYKLFPSALTLVIFPAWMAGIGFAFITLPVAYSHSALVLQFVRRTSPQAAPTYLASTLVVLPVIIFFIWIAIISVQSAFGDMSGIIAPDGPAFAPSNATMNAVVKYAVTFLVAAWGSTLLMLRENARKVDDSGSFIAR